MKKKVILVLFMVFIAAPAFAGITVECNQVTPQCEEVVIEVKYEMDGSDANLPRAFGLDIYVDNGAAISSIYAFDPNFYVSPGTFDYNGGDPNWGIPVVNLDTNSFTVEMGSLYAAGDTGGHTTPPESSGVLFRFAIDANGQADCNIVIEENAARAGTDSNGVVMEDTEKSFPASYVTLVGIKAEVNECMKGHADYTQWASVGKPACWCHTRQCHGDADNDKYGFFSYWTSIPDLQVLKQAWNKPYGDLVDVNGVHLEYDGTPLICADFDHDDYGFFNYRVSIPDLTIMKNNWNTANKPDPNCSPGNRPCP
jgi:hypothetical protein